MTVIDQARGVDVHEGIGQLPVEVLRLLDDWLPGQRWFPVPGDGVSCVPWLTVVLPAGTPAAGGDVAGVGAGDLAGVGAGDVVVPLLCLTGPGLPDPGDEAALVIQVPLVLSPATAGESTTVTTPDAVLVGGLPGDGDPGGRPGGDVPSGDGPSVGGPGRDGLGGEPEAGELDPVPGDGEPGADDPHGGRIADPTRQAAVGRAAVGQVAVGRTGVGQTAVERSLIGVVDTPDGPVAVHDGGAHPAAWSAYLASALPVLPSLPSRPAVATHGPGDRDPENADVPGATDWLSGAHPLGGEQSNSSVLVPGLHPSIPGTLTERADGVILKILRTVPLGPHPDVVIPEALTRAGWTGVPRFLGAVELPLPAHLAVVSELITEADDGFELACAHAAAGRAFDEASAQLGAVVADMHGALARARPTDATLDTSAFMGVLRRRAAEAIADVARLAPQRAGITSFYDEVSERLGAVAAERPIPLQTIHGDLHLGQVLHARDGWKVLDFEGEPQRPVAERTAPDLPLRDVAGLLRSFDYAAAVGRAADPEWSADAQLSFLEGYREALGAEPGGQLDLETAGLLLRALTLDKALYEVVYESRHRPAWLHIPLDAVARTLDR